MTKTYAKEMFLILLFVILSLAITLYFSKVAEEKALRENTILKNNISMEQRKLRSTVEWKPMSELPYWLDNIGQETGCWKSYNGHYYYSEYEWQCSGEAQ